MLSAPLQAERLTALRSEIRRIEGVAPAGSECFLPFDLPDVDDRLAGGGLALRALHEVTAAGPDMASDAAATLFQAALAARFSRAAGNGQILWAVTRRDLFAPGLAQVGLTPDLVLYAECRNDAELLAVMEDGVRHGGLAAVLGEAKRADMAATRRLQLAAESHGLPALLFRRRRKPEEDPLAPPSAAVTRWRIGCAPSAPVPYDGLGRARWQVELVRQRGGPPFSWLMEAPDGEARFALPAATADRTDHAAGARIAA